jgi:hypothetical protein
MSAKGIRTQVLGLTQKLLEANSFITIPIEFFPFENSQSIFRVATSEFRYGWRGMTGRGRAWRPSSRQIAGATLMVTMLLGAAMISRAAAPSTPVKAAECRVESVDYRGWQAKEISNRWVRLVIVPQNGGRLMQVNFNGHDYFFVNHQLEGKYLPPSQDQWFNYGGDKLWLLPEGDDDEQHWRGNSDLLDDGPFSFRKLSDEQGCGAELVGPVDPHTGIQLSRTIRLDPDSPHIAFRASMKNVSGHTVEWSMQSVSQYDTSSTTDPAQSNRQIWGFTAANPSSHYLNRYHVRTGPAENPAATIRDDGLFSLHYSHVAAEFWVDSPDGWLAVVDGSSHYAMVERFQYEEGKTYPGKASVIFWTNGPSLRFSADGVVSVNDGSPSPFYMEAEINSPMCRLRTGEACQLETDWYPTRTNGEFRGVTDAGIVNKPLLAVNLENGKIKLSGSFGVFFPGRLVAYFYNEHGSNTGTLPIAEVNPTDLVVLDTEIAQPGKPTRVSLHLEDQGGLDRGALQEVPIRAGDIR